VYERHGPSGAIPDVHDADPHVALLSEAHPEVFEGSTNHAACAQEDGHEGVLPVPVEHKGVNGPEGTPLGLAPSNTLAFFGLHDETDVATRRSSPRTAKRTILEVICICICICHPI
jgi:hypothetical protein